MSSLPLLFKKEGLIEKHQVEGVDPSDRYFNRTILINRTPSGYAAKVMYEALNVEGHSHPTITAAVQELIEAMQRFGFSKLRTRANFKGTKYLAEKETWLDYQDLAIAPELLHRHKLPIHQVVNIGAEGFNLLIPSAGMYPVG